VKKEKKKKWSEDNWHAVNSAIGFLEWKTIDKIADETNVDGELVRLIIEDFMDKDPSLIIKRRKRYKYFHAPDLY
jgi:hypothetical protein